MSIERFVKRIVAKDTAVYWGPATSIRGDGSFAYATPVEVDCFWDDATETVKTDSGEEFVSAASVYTSLDLAQEGLLFHGALTDLTTAQKADPRKVHKAYEIKVFKKTPSLKFGHTRKAMI